MRRRNLVLTSACFLVVGLSCSPSGTSPQINVEEDGPTSTPCGSLSTSAYLTNFAAAENPISEGNRWINGKAVGLDWNDVQTTPGKAFAADFVGVTSRYNDPIAHLSTSFRTFSADQYAEGTVSRVPGYRNPGDKHEVELLLRFQITASSARGYEVLWGQDGEMSVVRWNGPLGDYTSLGRVRDPGPGAAVDGDILRAEIVGNEITVCKNGRIIFIVSDPDSTWTDGQPGIGFWPTPGSMLASYGWSTFEAGSL